MMQIVVLADRIQQEEISSGFTSNDAVIWINDEREFLNHSKADAFIDFKFINEASRKSLLQQLLPKPVIINSVVDTLKEINPSLIRINGWNTFLSSVIEASCADAALQRQVEMAFSLLNKKIEWLADEPGFVTARVISMIINEAFTALGEGVSTKEEINTAMKLGTAYPYGPFEWAEKIGVKNIFALLKKLSETNIRYKPAALLMQETLED